MLTKIGIKSCIFARECVSFVHAWMYLPSWNCVCMIAVSAACKVGCQNFLNSLNRACASLWPVCTWFVEITFISTSVRMCVQVLYGVISIKWMGRALSAQYIMNACQECRTSYRF